MDAPEPRYTRSGDLELAYQVVGEGPLDVMVVPSFFSNIEIDWEMPRTARFLGQLASFARLIQFDRRGAGMSGGVAGATLLEEQIDDVRAVLDATGAEQPVLLSIAEGCALAVLFAACHPDLVRALVLIAPTPRVVSGPGYEWAPSVEQRGAMVQGVVEHWGSSSPEHPWGAFSGQDEQRRRLQARHQRLSMTPDAAAASLVMVGELDVRDALASVQCPTLVLRRANDAFVDERHSRYAANHIPNAQYVEIPPDGKTADEIEQFVTGARPPVVSDRVLATVLFTDIVGSTEHAAQLGDGAWRELLEPRQPRARGGPAPPRAVREVAWRRGARRVRRAESRDQQRYRDPRPRPRARPGDPRRSAHRECELLADNDVGGIAVHIGARVSSLAGPGEVLVSGTVRDLIVGSGQTLTERGEHDLKGVPGPWRIFAVET